VPEDEISSESCLHCEINGVVREHIEGQKTVNIAELAGRMAASRSIFKLTHYRFLHLLSGRDHCASVRPGSSGRDRDSPHAPAGTRGDAPLLLRRAQF
jgi:hypothetical protein